MSESMKQVVYNKTSFSYTENRKEKNSYHSEISSLAV